MDEYGRTPISLAADNGHGEVVGLLMKLGADINKAANHGQTPLHCAACYGHAHVVQMLVAGGADVNKATKYGQTPLDVASGECKRILQAASCLPP